MKKGKLASLFNRLKNMTPVEMAEKIKENKENFTTQKVTEMAREAIDNARDFSREEIRVFLGKINDIKGKKVNEIKGKTTAEVEKIVENALKKLFKGLPSNMATAEVRKEIAHMLVEHNNKTILSTMKYLNNIVVRNMPRSFWAAQNFRKNIAKNLIKDAEKRIAHRNKVK